MKTKVYVYAVSYILFSLHYAFGGDTNEADFVLAIDSSRMASARRALPLNLKVTYTGTKQIKVPSLDRDLLDISFDVPQGWTLRKQPDNVVMSMLPPISTLQKGSSMSRTIDLQDFFSTITPGRSTLALTLRIWPDEGRAPQPFVLRATVPLDLADESGEELQKYVNTISRQIADERAVDKRKELYRAIMGVSSREVIAVLMEGLRDIEVKDLHDAMRRKAIDLVESFDSRQILVRYLAVDGGRSDQYFFGMWQSRGLLLSKQELELLRNARNPWIKLYALKISPKGRQVAVGLECFEAELADMTAYLEALKKSARSK